MSQPRGSESDTKRHHLIHCHIRYALRIYLPSPDRLSIQFSNNYYLYFLNGSKSQILEKNFRLNNIFTIYCDIIFYHAAANQTYTNPEIYLESVDEERPRIGGLRNRQALRVHVRTELIGKLLLLLKFKSLHMAVKAHRKPRVLNDSFRSQLFENYKFSTIICSLLIVGIEFQTVRKNHH